MTDSCEEGGEDNGAVNGGFQLPEHCSAECAAVPRGLARARTCHRTRTLTMAGGRSRLRVGTEAENMESICRGDLRPSDSLESQTVCASLQSH